MAVPLDQQFKVLKKGILEERVPVLHASGMQQHYFVTYIPSPTDLQDGSSVDQWLERMTFIRDDLQWLLKEEHAKFWCEISFNKEFHAMLDSYLRYAPRPQRSILIGNQTSIPGGQQLEQSVSRLMFMCILRMSTHKESAENFFTPQGFADVIYNNYIFDVPRLFDICSLYAIDNKELLSKMIGNILKQQLKYHDDLKIAIASINEIVTSTMSTFHTRTGAKKLDSNSARSPNLNQIIDFLYYIVDLSCTINRFFSVYPQGRIIFFQENFHLTLVQVLETFIRVFERSRQANEINDDRLNEIFEEAKYETVILFNDLLTSCCIDPLLENQNQSDHVESMIDACSLLVTEKRFLAAFEDYFDLRDIIDIVRQTTGLLDEQQITFYTNGVQQAIELYGTPSCKRKLGSPVKSTTSTNPEIQMILDLFPNLNEKYIRTCLDHYNNNVEQLVNALFENTVPENLKSKEETTAPKPAAAAATTAPWNVEEEEEDGTQLAKEFAILEQRANVYDYDEFDLFNQTDVDVTRIHRGKRSRHTPADLDDKSHLEGMSERYSRLGIVEDLTDDDYDDEYDDTYDDGIVNVQDKDDTIDKDLEKNENRLVGKQPRRFRQPAEVEDDEEEETATGQPKRRAQFVENPEVVRERWAQQRAAWQQRHQPHRSHAGSANNPEQQHDVVGSARGRGQSTTVSHNRQWKDQHKSSQGNHNRRKRAAQKSNRGLLS